MRCRQLLVITLFIVSCGSEEAPPTADIKHPQDQWLYRPVEVTSRIDRDGPHEMVNELAANFETPSLTIGQLEGPRPVVFGEVVDVTLDRQGRLYVLDGQFRQIRVFNRDGEHLTTTGGIGEGPGEFQSPPGDVHIGHGGQLIVINALGLHRFGWSGDSLVYERTDRPNLMLGNACHHDDALFVHGLALTGDVGLVHQMDGAEMTKSFGDVYAAPGRAAARAVRRSRIACTSAGVVIAPTSVLGEIHGYDTARAPSWIVVIEGYRPMGAWENTRGGVTARVPESGWDRLHALTVLGEDSLLVQYAFTTRDDRLAKKEFTELRSFLVNPEDGTVVGLGLAWPRILAADQNLLVAVRQDPYPVVSLHSR